jgi:hypothetical protein
VRSNGAYYFGLFIIGIVVDAFICCLFDQVVVSLCSRQRTQWT